MEDFFSYYDQVGSRPNNMVAETVRQFVEGRSAALDLGSGNFRDSRWLKKFGFERVVAVDPGDVEGFLHDGIEFKQMRIEDFVIGESEYDFTCACSVFHYLPVDVTALLIPRIMRGLRPGGIFSFNVLGEHDGWILDGLDRAYFNADALARIVAPYRFVKKMAEVKFPLRKKWHLRYVVLGNRE